MRVPRAIQRLTIGALTAITLASSIMSPVFAEIVAPTDPYYYAQNNIIFYGVGGACDATVGDTTGQGITPTKAQEDNTKIIIGVVKAYNLDQKAAIIAVMTGITESGLRNDANPNVPVSESNPNKQGESSDHDSVGVFQQRPSTGWSTFGNGTSQEIVWQLMDVAYSAQAFLGTPPGAQLPANLNQPSALKKGLQNVSGWESLDPWVAAQKVQVSAFSDGSNYKKNYSKAVSLVTQFWATTQAIQLPVSVTGGSGPAAATGGACNNIASQGKVMNFVVKYAWPTFHQSPFTEFYPGAPAPGPYPEYYKKAVESEQKNGGYVGSPAGVDCGGFITILMRTSGADPKYNDQRGPVTGQDVYLKSHTQLYKSIGVVSNTKQLQPGDIAIKNDLSHTYMYVGKMPGWGGDSVSASQGDRSPMASNTYDMSAFHWYRLIGGGQ